MFGFFFISLICCWADYYERHGSTGEFLKKIAKVYRYIEMCNPFFRIGSPFLWISNSMPRINNSFSRIATRFLDLKINKLQSERTNCWNWEKPGLSNFIYISRLRIFFQMEGTVCNPRERIRGNKLQIDENGFPVRENELHDSISKRFIFAFFGNSRVP